MKETQDGELAQVNTNIVQKGSDPISVNYRLKQSGGTWKVYDVLVDQISLVGNYRNQFNRIMNNKGYDALIKAIQQKVDVDRFGALSGLREPGNDDFCQRQPGYL